MIRSVASFASPGLRLARSSSDGPQIPRYNLKGRDVSLQAALEGTVLLQNNWRTSAQQGDGEDDRCNRTYRSADLTTGGGSGEVVASQTQTSSYRDQQCAREHKEDPLLSWDVHHEPAGAPHPFHDRERRRPARSHSRTLLTNKPSRTSNQSTTVEPVVFVPGATHRRPEPQEINAFYSHKGSDFKVPQESDSWTGYFTPQQAGHPRVFVHTDGRFRLYFDDRLVFDNTTLPKYILNQTTMD